MEADLATSTAELSAAKGDAMETAALLTRLKLAEAETAKAREALAAAEKDLAEEYSVATALRTEVTDLKERLSKATVINIAREAELNHSAGSLERLQE